jgi:uncharacterized membrane protein YqaE (UPF0057 family)
MKKTALALSVIFMIALFFSSCSNGRNLSIEKRRYGKGYYVHANGKRDVKADNKTEIATALNDEQTATAPVEVVVNKVNENKAAPTHVAPAPQKEKAAVSTVPASTPKVVAGPVQAVKKNAPAEQSRKNATKKKSAPRASDDVALVLIIILCFLLPPLAVYLSEGITTNFWIDLILTLLFFLPGVIFALIVCLT